MASSLDLSGPPLRPCHREAERPRALPAWLYTLSSALGVRRSCKPGPALGPRYLRFRVSGAGRTWQALPAVDGEHFVPSVRPLGPPPSRRRRRAWEPALSLGLGSLEPEYLAPGQQL